MRKWMKIPIMGILILLITSSLFGKAVTKTARQWLAELPGGKVYTSLLYSYLDNDELKLGTSSTLYGILSYSSYRINADTDVYVTGDLDIAGNNLNLGSANIDYDSTNYEVDFDTSVNMNAKPIVNIVNCGTDFGAYCGLTIAGTLATTGNLDINGSLNMSYVVAADSTTLTASSATVVNCSKATPQEITLPTAVGNTGLYFIIKKTGAAGIVTITTNSTETIDGADGTTNVDAQYDFVGIVSDGANWIVVNRYIQ